jgi:hypothetical protein
VGPAFQYPFAKGIGFMTKMQYLTANRYNGSLMTGRLARTGGFCRLGRIPHLEVHLPAVGQAATLDANVERGPQVTTLVILSAPGGLAAVNWVCSVSPFHDLSWFHIMMKHVFTQTCSEISKYVERKNCTNCCLNSKFPRRS